MTAKKTKAKPAANAREPAVQLVQAPAQRPKVTPQWHEQAAFHVTLDHAPDAGDTTIWRTHVYHEESGEEQIQPGILRQDVVGWIRERAGAPSEPPAQVVAPEAEPRLNVDELAIEEIEREQQAGGAAIKRLRARVCFAVANPANQPSSQAPQYAIQVLAYARDADRTAVLAFDRRQPSADTPSYAEEFEFDLPPIGEYQLLATVVWEEHDLVGAVLGPRLAVVP